MSNNIELERICYAQENGHSEHYYTKANWFFTRRTQMKRIDTLLASLGYTAWFSLSLSNQIDGALERYCPQAHKKYYNSRGTEVEIHVRYTYSFEESSGLNISVHRGNSQNDFVWTCTLFRNFFGLET